MASFAPAPALVPSMKYWKPSCIQETSSPTFTLYTYLYSAGKSADTPFSVPAALDERSPITNWLPSPIEPLAARAVKANSPLSESTPAGSSGSTSSSPSPPETAPSVRSITTELSFAIYILPAPRTTSLAITKTFLPEKVTLELFAITARIAW